MRAAVVLALVVCLAALSAAPAAGQSPAQAPAPADGEGMMGWAPGPAPAGGPSVMEVEWAFPSALGLDAYPEMPAKVGDTAVFTWTGFHGVWALPDAACPTEFVAGPGSEEVALASDAGTWSVTFDAPGTYTYACQVGSHCAAGMIITFNVEA